MFLGYLKAGPEMRLQKNFYAEMHIGLVGLMIEYFVPGIFPFIGATTGYRLPLSAGFNLEMEAGANIPIGTISPLVYLMFGVSF
ncbi:MAG: hypothetical protein FJ213_10350 [Ignavibacteria bacterium]|nr:hypothetical protein [Ignavibacteria bacterium]